MQSGVLETPLKVARSSRRGVKPQRPGTVGRNSNDFHRRKYFKKKVEEPYREYIRLRTRRAVSTSPRACRQPKQL
jgi:hypothetical protein